jgi:hypothetical protein
MPFMRIVSLISERPSHLTYRLGYLTLCAGVPDSILGLPSRFMRRPMGLYSLRSRAMKCARIHSIPFSPHN